MSLIDGSRHRAAWHRLDDRRWPPGLVAAALLVPLVVPTVPFAAAAPPPDAGSDRTCTRLPRDQRVVKLTFKPGSFLYDVITMYALLSCKKLEVIGEPPGHRVARFPTDKVSAGRSGA